MDRIYSAIFSESRISGALKSLCEKKNDRFVKDSKKIACSSRIPLLFSTIHDTRVITPDEPSLPVQYEILLLLKFSLRAAATSCGVKALSSLLLAVQRRRHGQYVRMDGFHRLINKDTLRFGAFMGSLVAVFRGTEMVLRRRRGERTRIDLAIAGT